MRDEYREAWDESADVDAIDLAAAATTASPSERERIRLQ
jgi:hypothetical protein